MKFWGKNKRKKFIKGVKGSISIFLCLITAPFLMVTLGLVEYVRYQQVMEVSDEVMEVTNLSTLADYDEYIHKRFGLLATTQEKELGEDAEELLKINSGVLGSQIQLENPSFQGGLALSNNDVLYRQIVDFSELTSTTAILSQDFNLEQLMEKLSKVSVFEDAMNTLDGLADLTDALKTAANKLKDLKNTINSLQERVTNAIEEAKTLAEDMAVLFEKLDEKGIVLPEDASPEEVDKALKAFCKDYLDDFKDLYVSGKSLMDNLKEIRGDFSNIKTSAEEFIEAVKDAEKIVDGLNTKNSADEDGSISQAATQTLEDVLDEMQKLVENSLSTTIDTVIAQGEESINTIINTAIESAGLKGITERYNQIVNGSYFSLPLTDTAKEDLTDLLKMVWELYHTGDTGHALNTLKEKLVPDINLNDVLTEVKNAFETAQNALFYSIGNQLKQMLTNLISGVKELFDLSDMFYDSDLDSFVDIGNAYSSPYQKFLDAIGSLFTALENFNSQIGRFNFFGALDAMRQMFSSIGDMMSATWKIAMASVQSIKELGTSLVDGKVQSLYEKLLISGYMRHNLPSRVDAGDYSYDADGDAVSLELKGEGLTGFAFNDIARPQDEFGEFISEGTTFLNLSQTLENLKNGHGDDKMFRGAELEYIRAGTNSEIANQIIVFFDLYFLRLLIDLPFILTSREVASAASAASIAAWVVYILYILAEPLCDALLLVKGHSIPLIHNKCWLTISGIDNFMSKLSSLADPPDKEADEINYQTHVLILLFIFVDSDTQISRLQNLIDLEAQEHYRQMGKEFSLGKAYTTFSLSADASFKPFFDLGIMSGGSSFWPKIKVKQSVGY